MMIHPQGVMVLGSWVGDLLLKWWFEGLFIVFQIDASVQRRMSGQPLTHGL